MIARLSDSLALAAEFPPATHAQWRKLVEDLLKGDSFEKRLQSRSTDGLVATRDRAGRFFGLDDRVTAALALPDLGAAVKGVVRLLLEHAGDDLSDDVLLVLGEPTGIDSRNLRH